ncbi:MAG: aminopeptidase N [Micromonosporaceae bacterium]
MATLTHDEAVRRAALLDVESYTVDLDLTRGPEVFGSRSVIRFRCTEPGAESFVELKPVRLYDATLNGVPLDHGLLTDNRLRLTGLRAENELVVSADMAYSHTGEGLHRYTDPADGEVYLYAQTFLDDAQRMFACFDQPDLKAKYLVSATAPPEWTVIANSPGERVASDEAGVPAGSGRWEFAETKPLSTYFVTLAAGRWHSRYVDHDGIPLGIHSRQSYAAALDADTEEIFTITRQCFDRYHQLFEPRYPFGKYDQVFVPEFNAGAMENPGCVTFRDELFLYRSAASDAQREMRAMVIAHEMAHMWFGDLVTLRWWDDVWLNESFAEYLGHRVAVESTRFTEAWTTFSLARKGVAYAADQRPSTHPVAGTVPNTAQALLSFDAISYVKGASVLRQLVTWLGDKVFLAGLNEYFARHPYGNASLADLLAALQAHTDRDLQGWADRWLITAQLNTLRPVLTAGADGRLSEVVIEQSAPEGYPTLRPHRIGVGLYDADPDGAVRLRRQVAVDLAPDVDAGRTPVPALVGERRPALVMPNDGDLTYGKIRLDPESWATVAQRLHRIEDPLTRTLLWGAAWDLVRDGELPVAEYLRLVRDHLPYESLVGVLESVVGFARSVAVDRYTTAQRRTAAMSELAATCRELMAHTEPGSSAQLIGARGFAGSAVAPADLKLLRRWLSDVDVPAGLRVEAELRWLMLRRLVLTGLAGEREIAAEVARDPGDEAERGARRCRAALPDPAAKAAAWAEIAEGELTPHLLMATVTGFWQPEQADLLAEYLPRYFDALPEITVRRASPEVDKVLGRAGFPEYAVSAEVVAMAEKLLAAHDVRPALARFVSDQLDETRRALRARTGG